MAAESAYLSDDDLDGVASASSESSAANSNVDRPRVAQWEDDEELEVSTEEPEQPIAGPSSKAKDTTDNVQSHLSSLSFASLLKARHVLAKTTANSDGESSEESVSEEGERDEVVSDQPKNPAKSALKTPPPKRSNKHAPVEMSAKFPVARKKPTMNMNKPAPRDPRFSALSGELSLKSFHSQYSFLADLHTNELSTLKENLKRAQKMLRSSPRDLREEREEEVRRLEIALKRAESSVNRDKQDRVARNTMDNLKREESEKRKQGKTGWWMKSSAKKEIILKARHDALAETGGNAAVKKAIEKRQQKINQKEKRSRPAFAPSDAKSSLKRRDHSTSEADPRKRRRNE